MGRKLNISQPAVIQTELRPLDESFWIDANGRFEQWYYQNTNVFAPDRQITPLILTPYLSAVDRDTNITYTPSFQLDSWEVKEYIDGAWVTTTITSQSQTADYVLQGLSLIVKKNNYDATHAINITCKATYQDPRDEGSLHYVADSVMLVTSVDATQAFPKIDIVNPATRTYNPLKDESPIYEFEGKADWDGVEAQGGTAITECKVDPLGTEQILPTNDEMMLNAAPTLNIHYGDIEKANQKFMYRQTANGEVAEIVGGVSAIDNIKGNTIAWNQLVENGNFADGTTGWDTYNVTISVSNNEAEVTLGNIYGGISQSPRYVVGHKYYYCSQVKTSEGERKIYISSNVNQISKSINATNTYHTLSGIASIISADSMFAIEAKNGDGWSAGEKYYVKNVMLIDLTLIYGEGNEPTTVEEFETWLANNVGLKGYYEYCPGKLVNFGGFGVKWNQLKVNGNFSDGLNDWFTNGGVEIVISNNTATLTYNGANFQRLYKYFSVIAGHKYYACVDIKAPDNLIELSVFFDGDYTGTDSAYANIWHRYSIIKNYTTTSDSALLIIASNQMLGTSGTAQVRNVMIIDLTLMFGAGNEPTLEWCNKYFSKDYYPYCPSVDRNILDVMTTKESGFNIWDEEWEVGNYENGVKVVATDRIRSKNRIMVLPNSTYFLTYPSNKEGGVYFCFYDINGSFLTEAFVDKNFAFQTPSNAAYANFATQSYYGNTYNHDICINVSDPERNGEYEPYHAQYKSPEMGIKTTGFNQWDEEWELGYWYNGDFYPINDQLCTKNKVKVISGATYYYKCPSNQPDFINYFDELGNFVSMQRIVGNDTFQVPSNVCYLTMNFNTAYGTTYNHDICINISDPAKNGTYEPYWESKSDMSWITKIGIENFNIWDEEWELGTIDAASGVKTVNSTAIRFKNYIPCLGATNYYIQITTGGSAFYLMFYDENKTYLGFGVAVSGTASKQFTTPSGARYMMLRFDGHTTYNYDICINISNAYFNGRYYPHGETAPYFLNGLCKAGSIFDEVKVENGKIKGVVRIGSVDLGSKDWAKEYSSGSASGVYSSSIPAGAKVSRNIQCSQILLNEVDAPDWAASTWSVYTYYGISLGSYSGGQTIVCEEKDKHPTSSDFKSAMNGVMLYYELATPYEFEIDYPTKGQFMWYGVDGSGNEVPIDQLPIYSQATQPSGYGQGTSRININALYGENIPVMLRVKRYPWSPTVLPPKVTKSVAWSIPPVDVITTSDKGSAVRATNSSEDFIFGTIVNQQGEIISEEKKAENMVFDWYMVKYGTSGAIKTSLGSGLTKTIPAATLKNTTPNGGVTPSTNVYCEAFLLGAYHLVDGQYVRTKD